MFTLLDIGARGGPPRRWQRTDVRRIGFEPDADASSPGFDFVLPYALSDARGTGTLHITRKPGCSSLLKPNLVFLSQFPNVGRFDILSTVEVPLATLDQLTTEHEGVTSADALKLDTQGSEDAILRGASNLLRRIAGVEVEVLFQPLYEGAPLFADIDQTLRASEFELIDLQRNYWQRKQIGGKQLVVGQALYARLDHPKAAFFLSAYGYGRRSLLARLRGNSAWTSGDKKLGG